MRRRVGRGGHSSDLDQKYELSDGQAITRGADLNGNLRKTGVDLVLVAQLFAEDQSERLILVTEVLLNSKAKREKLTQIMFQTLNTPAL